MGVDLEAMVGFLGGDHRLKNFFELYSFNLACMYKLVHTRSMIVIDKIIFYNDLTGR
jgi:hypothetical protein